MKFGPSVLKTLIILCILAFGSSAQAIQVGSYAPNGQTWTTYNQGTGSTEQGISNLDAQQMSNPAFIPGAQSTTSAAKQTHKHAMEMYGISGQLSTKNQRHTVAIISYGNAATQKTDAALSARRNRWNSGEKYGHPSYMDYNSDASYDPDLTGVDAYQHKLSDANIFGSEMPRW